MTSTAVRKKSRVCPPQHRHGETGTCYHHHKCRCAGCCAGVSAREKRRVKLHAYGRYVSPWIPAQPVREHVEMLRSAGMGYKTIALRAGIGPTGVRSLIYGREDYQNGTHGPRHGEVLQRIDRVKAEKILAVQPTLENLPKVAHIPARGTVRRIQALMASGWSQAKLAAQLGVDGSNLSIIRRRYEHLTRTGHAGRAKVRASTALAVERLYDRLSVQSPPRSTPADRVAFSRSVALGKANGWPLPMDWEAFDNNFDQHRAPTRRLD